MTNSDATTTASEPPTTEPTTTEPTTTEPPTTEPNPRGATPSVRKLRRSTDDRVVSGVCGGLGDYFNVDPVIFRVLFATTAFFGGIGIIAYLIGWAAIAEPGNDRTGLDRLIAEMRQRRVPVWPVLIVGAIVVWSGLFSWWSPWGFVPALIAAAILVPALRRRKVAAPSAAGSTGADHSVSLTKSASETDGQAGSPAWVADSRSWFSESRAAARERRRRAAPLRWTTLGVLVLALALLSIIDQVHGIAIATYFWTAGAIVLTGLFTGIALRRTPWSIVLLLPFTWIGLLAFSGSSASLHDGVGSYSWSPTTASALRSEYRLALGRTVLDLSHLEPLQSPRTVEITMGAGQVVVITHSSAAVQVNASILRGGQIETGTAAQFADSNKFDRFDGPTLDRTGGIKVSRQFAPDSSASGPVLTVNIHLADGDIQVER